MRRMDERTRERDGVSMIREIDERVFWCKTQGDEVVSYQLPPVGRGLPKRAVEYPLIYPVIDAIKHVSVDSIVRCICAVPKRREDVAYKDYVLKWIMIPKRGERDAFLKDFFECLRETFITYARLGFLGYTDTAIAVRNLREMVGNREYNQKRVKMLLKILCD